jgi:hypothetical protein
MEAVVPFVLAAWVGLTTGLFWKRPGRDAALLALFGGWALLPTGVYPAAVCADPVGSGGSMHALAVPTSLVINKALAIGLGCLVGVVLFDWPAVQRLRPTRLDAPILAWCLTPMASTVANRLPIAGGLAQTRYLVLAWGVPYALGRIYLGSPEALRRMGLALVLAGIVSVPLGVLEFVAGPFLYSSAYGRHPYLKEGAERLAGHRPLLFLEHGNQLGVWIAVSTVAAAWLWWSGRMASVARLPGRAVAAGLLTAGLAFQSHEALGVTLAVLALLPFSSTPDRSRTPRQWSPKRRASAAVGAAVLALAVAGSVAVAAAGDPGGSGLRGKVRGLFHGIGKSSFTWRLARSQENLPRIAERPVLGWGRADWSAGAGGTFFNPVNLGLWLLVSGMFGAVGLIAAGATLLVPVAEVLRRLPIAAWTAPGSAAVALAAVLLVVVAFDALFNSVVLLPLLAGAGGIHSWSTRSEPGRGH